MYDLTKPHCSEAHSYKEVDHIRLVKTVSGIKKPQLVKGSIRYRCVHNVYSDEVSDD